MPAKEIKELREAKKFNEALTLAQSELQSEPENIWAKRNLCWVYYSLIKENNIPDKFEMVKANLQAIRDLCMPEAEAILFDSLSFQIGKMGFGLLKQNPVDIHKFQNIFEIIKDFHFTQPSEGYSLLFKPFHKAFKDTETYIPFADWWNLTHFRPEDFQSDKLENGKEMMSLAEQAYIAYAKHLLPRFTRDGQRIFDREKAQSFLPIINKIVEEHPSYQYPPYFQAKLLLALGDRENVLSALLPFAKKKRNDFWAWDVLSEAFPNDKDKNFACYCRALTCNSPEEMLVNLRQRMAAILIEKNLYNEARTEIELLVEARRLNGWPISNQIQNWQNQDWYINATSKRSNKDLYRKYLKEAEDILFSDVPEELVFVEFVNSDRRILYFIVSEEKFGSFKYDRFLESVEIGDILKVRFQPGSGEGKYRIYTASKTVHDDFRYQFCKNIEGVVRIPQGKPFGFLDDVFIHPSKVNQYKIIDGMHFKGAAVKSYNIDKKIWGWKLL